MNGRVAERTEFNCILLSLAPCLHLAASFPLISLHRRSVDKNVDENGRSRFVCAHKTGMGKARKKVIVFECF